MKKYLVLYKTQEPTSLVQDYSSFQGGAATRTAPRFRHQPLRSEHEQLDPPDPRTTDRPAREGLGREPALEGHQARLQRRRRGEAARLPGHRAHAGQARRREALEPDQHRALRQHAGRADRQPGHAAGQGRPQGHLPLRLAGRRRRQQQRRDVPRPVAVLGGLRAEGASRRSTTPSPAPTRSSGAKARAPGRGLHRLLRAHRGGRRSRLRRRAERLRADEGHDRGGRRRRALRGPARLGQEVRPHGRQGAGAHPRSRRQAGRRAPGRRRDGHAHHPAGPHRRGSRRPGDQRRGPDRPALLHRRAHGGRLLPHQEGLRPGREPRPGLRRGTPT